MDQKLAEKVKRKILEKIEEELPKVLESLNEDFWEWMRKKEPCILRWNIECYFNYTRKEREEE